LKNGDDVKDGWHFFYKHITLTMLNMFYSYPILNANSNILLLFIRGVICSDVKWALPKHSIIFSVRKVYFCKIKTSSES